MERGLEFYVMLAAVAVGALTWLYKKGSRIWRTVRKLRRYNDVELQRVCRVVVVLVVLRCVDTALGRDRVGAAGRILNAEYLDVVAQFAERSGCGGASQTRTDDDDVELALVGGAYDLDSCLMVAPLFGQSTGRNFSI